MTDPVNGDYDDCHGRLRIVSEEGGWERQTLRCSGTAGHLGPHLARWHGNKALWDRDGASLDLVHGDWTLDHDGDGP